MFNNSFISIGESSIAPSMMAKRKMEKSYQDLKLKKEMKKKFRTTKISSLSLIDLQDST